ncbi:exonuclease domain-containing protein [Pseudodonghicola flavimaris]|uniref:Exonuclease domain-containing protein n=1 Tax=Pseudodonghicola flavimaris TaxID=3050036 RepID=A0ABT7F3T6_9RHOB|nr:exonuclease domain-containing protein [Pseudodonghicola flavimaris]MDK3019257.1 exonuclease domain-containing protein [Pseudodonghicola flavimaris]
MKSPAPEAPPAASPDLLARLAPVLSGDYRFIAVDVETANADTSSICQFGLAFVRPDGAIDTLDLLIDPEMYFDSFNTALHGISAATVEDCPGFALVLPPLRPLLARHSLIQHSGFDQRAIAAACRRYGLPTPHFAWHDSLAIARRAWPELRNRGGHGLANLKTHLGLEFTHHHAGEDARAAALVVLRAEAVTGLPFDKLSRRG